MRRENERRTRFRFALERDLRYKMAEDGDVVVSAGTGKTINMGSGGVAINTEKPLSPGGYLELSISWPVLLDETLPMRLIVFGRVLRCTGCKAVCSVDKYEFRTQSRTFLTSATTRPDGMLQRWAEGLRKETLRASMAGV